MPSPFTSEQAPGCAATRLVGIGASAGGLTALEQFLSHTPADSGMAFLVVQHLDPTQRALLPELLQRTTSMRVYEAEEGMQVEPDCVYVIPPNTELSVVKDALHLAAPVESRGLRLPINVLFSSLARARGANAAAIVLSGMGSDGSVGVQAVRAVGGLTGAQEPGSAQFDSMPNSAIATGCIDFVAPPAELPARILACIDRMPLSPPAEAGGSESESATSPTQLLQRIVRLLQERTGHDFSLYKTSTLYRRIERRMSIHRLSELPAYADILTDNPQEVDLLFQELLIGVTSFFRDPSAWECMVEEALPHLLSQRHSEDHLRAWVIGCSTGEEAYSLAIAFRETVEKCTESRYADMKIFATDLSADAIATARLGQYPLSISDTVSTQRLSRFFDSHDTHFQVTQTIRDMVLFAEHDVVLDPPFTAIDLIACRNLLIYFDSSLQSRLLPLFHYSLRSDGLLFLGTAETVGRFHHLFMPIHPKQRIYRRLDYAANAGTDILLNSFPPLSRLARNHVVSHSTTPDDPADDLKAAADQVLLQVYAPAAVVLNGDGDIVYISGRTGEYLEPAAGRADWNFHAMARDGLASPVRNALKRSRAQHEPVHLHGLKVTTPGGTRRIDVTVQAFEEAGALQGMAMILFRDGTETSAVDDEGEPASELEAVHAMDLQQYRDEMESLREDARASREKLQSSNEELQSTNEELQSANEELMTSKEEMQSMNEELETINSELQSKLDDLALAQSDMQNVLNSIDIAILFLDQELNVRRYTERMSAIISLRESDVGRPLSDLTTSLQYKALQDDAWDTLQTLVPSEKQVPTDDGHWFSVRIMPYRRLDNIIDGVVITFVDITATKELESSLRRG